MTSVNLEKPSKTRQERAHEPSVSGSARSPSRRAQRGHRRPRAQRARRRAREHRAEVRQAIADLDRQRTQLRLVGRTFIVDVVMQAPERFTAAVRTALEAELPPCDPPSSGPASTSASPRPSPRSSALLDRSPPRLARRPAQGARRAGGREAVERLDAAGIPVVTLVTDVPASRRLAYVGIDNRAAGTTAAYLLGQWLGDRPAPCSSPSAAARSAARRSGRWASGRRCAAGTAPAAGRDHRHRRPRRHHARTRARAPCAHPDVARGLLDRRRQQRDRSRRSPSGPNVPRLHRARPRRRQHALLRDGRLSAVLHHDLRPGHAPRLPRDHAGAPGAAGWHPVWPSSIQVVTPFNAPEPPPPEHR